MQSQFEGRCTLPVSPAVRRSRASGALQTSRELPRARTTEATVLSHREQEAVSTGYPKRWRREASYAVVAE